MRAERATGAPKARRAERASAQAEHAGTRWSHNEARIVLRCSEAHPQAALLLLTKVRKYEGIFLYSTRRCTTVHM